MRDLSSLRKLPKVRRVLSLDEPAVNEGNEELGKLLPSMAPNPREAAEQAEERELAARALRTVVEKCRQEDREVLQVLGRAFSNRSNQELAEELGLRERGFRQRMVKVTVRVRHLLRFELRVLGLDLRAVDPKAFLEAVFDVFGEDDNENAAPDTDR